MSGLARLYSLAVYMGLMLGLPFVAVSAAHAEIDCTKVTIPGCDCDHVLKKMETRANVQRISDRAVALQIVKQPDNTLGMTCFDRSLAQTARLGQIFSDVLPSGTIPPQVSTVFGTSTFPTMGMDKSLLGGMGSVIGVPLEKHAANFTQSLSSALGATVMGGFNVLASTVTTALGALGFNTLTDYISDINAAYTQVKNVMQLLRIPMPAAVIGAVSSINAAWTAINSGIKAAYATIVSTLRTAINAVMDPIKNGINGMLGGSFAPGSGPCDRMQQLWGNGQPAGFVGLIGGSIEKSVPYIRLADRLETASVSGDFSSMPGLGAQMEKQLNNTNHIATMSKAYDEIADISAGVGTPGHIPTWTKPPTYAQTDNLCTVMLKAGLVSTCP